MNISDRKKIDSSIETELTINAGNINDKLFELPKLTYKYKKLFVKQYGLVKYLKGELESCFGELFEFYKFNYKYKLDTIKEIESFIKQDKKYVAKLNTFNEQEAHLKYLEGIIEAIKQLSYNIKSYIEWRKFTEGA